MKNLWPKPTSVMLKFMFGWPCPSNDHKMIVRCFSTFDDEDRTTTVRSLPLSLFVFAKVIKWFKLTKSTARCLSWKCLLCLLWKFHINLRPKPTSVTLKFMFGWPWPSNDHKMIVRCFSTFDDEDRTENSRSLTLSLIVFAKVIKWFKLTKSTARCLLKNDCENDCTKNFLWKPYNQIQHQ